jgi:hypothetical protein
MYQLSPWFINQYRSSHIEIMIEIHNNIDLYTFETLNNFISLYNWNIKLLQIYYYSRGGCLDLSNIPASTLITLHNPQFDEIIVSSPLAGVHLIDDWYSAPLPAINIYAHASTKFIPTLLTKNIWLYDNVFRDPIAVAAQLRQLHQYKVAFVGSTDTETQVARIYGTLFPHIDLFTAVDYDKSIKYLADVPDTMIFANLSPTPLRNVTKRFKNTNTLLFDNVPSYHSIDKFLNELWEQKNKNMQTLTRL